MHSKCNIGLIYPAHPIASKFFLAVNFSEVYLKNFKKLSENAKWVYNYLFHGMFSSDGFIYSKKYLSEKLLIAFTR